MQLLSQKKIDTDKKVCDEESRARTNKLADEESRLVRLVNLTKERVKKEMDEIEANFAEYKKDVQKRISILRDELVGLENRKKEALKPIDDINKRANKLLKEAQEANTVVECKRIDLELDKERNIEFAEELKDRSDELDSRSKKLDKRDEDIKTEESRVRVSRENLTSDWVKYHEAVNQLNTKILSQDDREAKLNSFEKTLNIRKQSQDDRDNNLDNKERAINDKYVAFEQALKHTKKQKHG